MKKPLTKIDLPIKDQAFILKHLKRLLPKGTKILVFGSRLRGTARKYSDLDLALEGKEKIPDDCLIHIAEFFSESDLPYHIDVVDLKRADESFVKHILQTVFLWHTA